MKVKSIVPSRYHHPATRNKRRLRKKNNRTVTDGGEKTRENRDAQKGFVKSQLNRDGNF